jgi:hypothetical protein
MKAITTLLIAGALTGCEIPVDGTSFDGYRFELKEFNNLDTKIEFVVHGSYGELREAARSLGIKNHKSVRAFSTLHRPDYKRCVVHIVDPSKLYAPEYIGHEITHCIYGRWHDYSMVVAANRKRY